MSTNGKKLVSFPDTNALLRIGEALITSGTETIVIAAAMIEELDHLKHMKRRWQGITARRISGIIAEFAPLGHLEAGVATKAGGKLYVLCSKTNDLALLPNDIPIHGNDSKLLALAKRWQLEHANDEVRIITNDHNLMIWANLCQIGIKPLPDSRPRFQLPFFGRRHKPNHRR